MASTNAYTHLERWSRPSNYFGATWDGWYSAGVGQSRDSDALERANFEAMKKRLRALPDVAVMTPTRDSGLLEASAVQIVRESHWAVGWVEWIAIHETKTAALELANKIMAKMEDYLVIDEELWSQFEDDECATVWTGCYNEAERVEYLRKHVSMPVKYPPHGMTPYQALRAAVKGDWGVAANLLPCPSDFIA